MQEKDNILLEKFGLKKNTGKNKVLIIKQKHADPHNIVIVSRRWRRITKDWRSKEGIEGRISEAKKEFFEETCLQVSNIEIGFRMVLRTDKISNKKVLQNLEAFGVHQQEDETRWQGR